MKKAILPDVETFEFVTSMGTHLDLHGALISWSDTLSMGWAEHQILKRDGALHQNLGAKPRHFSFVCVLLGKNLTARYQALIDTLEEDPTGILIHPRFGSLPAIYKDISVTERPADEISTIRFTIQFVRTELQGLRKAHSETLAAAASETLQALLEDTKTTSHPEQKTSLLQVQSCTFAYQQKANEYLQGRTSLFELSNSLEAVRTQMETVRNMQALTYRVKAQVALVFSYLLASYQAARSNLPPVVSFQVSGAISIHRLCASLYGGKHARSMVSELVNLNRIPNPYHIPAGTDLFLPDPQTVKTHAR